MKFSDFASQIPENDDENLDDYEVLIEDMYEDKYDVIKMIRLDHNKKQIILECEIDGVEA